METTSLAPDEIVIGDRLRSLNPQTVETLKESITKLGGIKTPLSVRFISNEDGFLLVAGRHRLQAAIELNMPRVPVREEPGTELDARLWEIAENLHRAELTVQERSDHIAEWLRLSAEKETQDKLRQVDEVFRGGRGQKGGRSAAAREIGITEPAARRAEAIAALPVEVRAEAKILHLDDNQSALLNASKQTGKEEQIRALREHAVKRVTFSEASSSEKRIEKFQSAAKALSPEEFTIAAEWFDDYRKDRGGTVFDRTAAGGRR